MWQAYEVHIHVFSTQWVNLKKNRKYRFTSNNRFAKVQLT